MGESATKATDDRTTRRADKLFSQLLSPGLSLGDPIAARPNYFRSYCPQGYP